MATKEEVQNFLDQLRAKISITDYIVFRNRGKNRSGLDELNILPIDREEFIKGLCAEDYYRGPRKDEDDLGAPDFFEFGIMVKKREVYIKISLGREGKRVDCMSFHPSEYEITYPLKK